MGNCCCTPPPDAPPLGACCFREDRDNLITANPNASRQNQINPYDANGDGIVNESDAGFLNDYLKGLVTGGFPDVNGDGAVSPIDTLIILNHLNFRDNPVSFFGDTKCVNNVTETECLLGYTHAAREETIDGTNHLVKRGYASFKPEQTCGSTETCPITSDTYNSVCGDIHCPRYICNVETGECGLTIPEGADLTKWPYTLVDNCTECQKTQPGCCCRYWTDPEGILPDYNITEYVADQSLCQGTTTTDYLNKLIEVTNTFTPNYSTDAAGQPFCEGHAPCNKNAGWYCVTDSITHEKSCRYFNSSPDLSSDLILDFSGPYDSEIECDGNCSPVAITDQGKFYFQANALFSKEDIPKFLNKTDFYSVADATHRQSDETYNNKPIMDKVFLNVNDCREDELVVLLPILSRGFYDLTGKAGPASVDIKISTSPRVANGTSPYTLIETRTIIFETPNIIANQKYQEKVIEITLPKTFFGLVKLELVNPTNGSSILEKQYHSRFYDIFGVYTEYDKVYFDVIEELCNVCCKNYQVILRNVTPCDCDDVGGRCSKTNCDYVNGQVPGRCCISASCPDDDPCPEVGTCVDEISPGACNQASNPLIINGRQFSASYSFTGGANCNTRPKCGTTTTTTTESPFPCSCVDAGKINIAGGENGCLYTYNKSSDSFNLTSDCPEGGDCPYDTNCFRTPTLQDQDLFAVPCCGTPEPPPPCDYCCIDPQQTGGTNLTQEECEALNGHCINEKDFPDFTSTVGFSTIAKNYCSDQEIDDPNACPTKGNRVVYEGSGVHTPKTDTYIYDGEVGNYISFSFQEGLIHKNGSSFSSSNSQNSPFKVIIRNGSTTLMETDFLGSSSYQSALDSAIGGSNTIGSWVGYLTSGFILTDTSVEVSIYSPLQNNGWTYKLSCAQGCATSGSVGAFFETFAGDIRHYTDDQVLGINPNRNYDRYLTIQTKANNNPSSLDFIESNGLGLGGYSSAPSPCLLGEKLYLFYEGQSVDSEGDTIHTWTLGSGQQTVTADYRPSDGIDCRGTTIFNYSPTFSSNQFVASDEYCKDNSQYDCSSATITWSQARLKYQIKSDGLGGCLEKFTVPTSDYNATSCQIEPQLSFKIGCIDAAVIDYAEGGGLPPEEDFPKPFRWSASNGLRPNAVYLYIPDYITEDRYKNCPCFNGTCCDGSTGQCSENTTFADCECLFGTGFDGSSDEEIASDPCAVHYLSQDLGYHPCTEGCNTIQNANGYSCAEIHDLCTGF